MSEMECREMLRTGSQHMVNLSDEVALAARLQNRTCTFRRIRLLNGLAVVISTSGEAWEMCFESLNSLRRKQGIPSIHRS